MEEDAGLLGETREVGREAMSSLPAATFLNLHPKRLPRILHTVA